MLLAALTLPVLSLWLPVAMASSNTPGTACPGPLFAFITPFDLDTTTVDYSSLCGTNSIYPVTDVIVNSLLSSALRTAMQYCEIDKAFFTSIGPSCVFMLFNGDISTDLCTERVGSMLTVACIGPTAPPEVTGTSTSTITVPSTITLPITTTTNTIFIPETSFDYVTTISTTTTIDETVTSVQTLTTTTSTTTFRTTQTTTYDISTSLTTRTIKFLEVSTVTSTISYLSTVTSFETAVLESTTSTTLTVSSCPESRTTVIIVSTTTVLTVTNWNFEYVTETVPVTTRTDCRSCED